MNYVTFYDIQVPYDGRPLGLVLVDDIHRDVGMLVSDCQIPIYRLQEASRHMPKPEFVGLMEAIHQYCDMILSEQGALEVLTRRETLETRRTEMDNTRQFTAEAAKVLKG